MKFIARFLYVPLAGLLVLTSCAKEETESYDKFENQALEAWMTQHRSDLVENLQSEGLYYIDLLDAGDLASDPINTEDIWVSFDFSGRDLSGNIILTRNADDAVLAGSFSKYTHYVPFYRYCGSENSGLMEGTWLAMRRTLTLGDTYFRNNKDRLGITSPEVTLRYGSKIRLYMPSSVVGNGNNLAPLRSNEYGESSFRHHQPLSFGIAVRKEFAHGLSLESGVNYTLLRSDVRMQYTSDDVAQKLHFIGVPLRFNWQFLERGRFSLYMGAGGMVEKCVSAKLGSKTVDEPGVQWSALAAVGAQYRVGGMVGLYFEPEGSYYFTETGLRTSRTDSPLTLTLRLGVRLSF